MACKLYFNKCVINKEGHKQVTLISLILPVPTFCRSSSNFSRQESLEVSFWLASSLRRDPCYSKSEETMGDQVVDRSTITGSQSELSSNPEIPIWSELGKLLVLLYLVSKLEQRGRNSIGVVRMKWDYTCEILVTNLAEWKWKLLSCTQLFVTPWTIQSVEFSRPEYWSG